MDNKAQISLEMILVVAAVLAVAVILFSSFQSISNSGSARLDTRAKNALSEIVDIK